MNEIRVPSLGDIVTECIVAEWYVEPGEAVRTGAEVVEITADKASLLLESPADGVLLHRAADPGALVPVGGVLGVVGPEDADGPADVKELAYPQASPDACMRFRDRMDAPSGSVEPLSPMRTVVAKRMARSAREAPHWYITSSVDMTGCVELRKRLKKEERVRVSYNDMIIRAAGLALREHPRVAAAWTDHGYVVRDRMHVGFAAVVGEDGLCVPVVRDADRASLVEVSKDAKRLADAARNRKLSPADFVGGVFTVSNMGSFDVDTFIAIINPGESAILAVGSTVDTPVVRDGEIVVRPMMNMTLSCDHRVIDGVLAANFSRHVKRLLENPEEIL